MDDKTKIEKAHCNNCQHETNHWIRATHHEKGQHEEWLIWWSNTFSVLQCCGCDEVRFQRAEQFSEDMDHQQTLSGEWEPYYPVKKSYYPPAKWRHPPRWASALLEKDEALSRIHDEVYTAIQSDSRFLAGAGSRALIERVLSYTVGEEGTFGARLRLLAQKGFIAGTDVETIETALEAGHASAHRGWIPSREAIETVMNIVENLIERVYILSDSAKSLRPKIPSRSSK